MITRMAQVNESNVVADLIARCGGKTLTTPSEVSRFLCERSGDIVVTHRRDGEIMAMFVYHVNGTDKAFECDWMLFRPGPADDLEAMTQSIRRYLSTALRSRGCTSIRALTHGLKDDFLAIATEIGFVLTGHCPCCSGGLLVFSLDPAMIGGLLVERILAGNPRVMRGW